MKKVAVSLTINGLSICGGIGKGASITISVQDCWQSYCNLTRKLTGNLPLCILRSNAIWAVNGIVIDEPKTWFITLTSE